MSLSSILKSLSPSSPHARTRRRPSPRRRPAARPSTLEALEDRRLLSCTVSLAPGEAAPQLVGERITWTATAADCGATPVYQFSAAPHDGAFRVVRDFSPTNSFAWTPMQEGAYDIKVTVKDGYQAAETTTAVATDAVASRVTGSQPVITPTLNPLVALYSVPPTQPGPGPHGTVHVEFSVAGDQPSWRSTNELPSSPHNSTNVFVAGMLPSTTYEMRDVFSDGATSSPLLFTTGSLPTTLTFPTFTVQQPPGPGSDADQDLIYHSLAGPALNGNLVPNPLLTDLSGRVEWYYDTQRSGLGITNMINATLLPGGTVIGLGNDGDYSFTLGTDGPEPVRPPAHTVEVRPDGTKVYDLVESSGPEYRSFRVRTLYDGIDDALAGAPRQADSIVLHDGPDRPRPLRSGAGRGWRLGFGRRPGGRLFPPIR